MSTTQEGAVEGFQEGVAGGDAVSWEFLRLRRSTCGGCGEDVGRVALVELVYTFEVCDCDEWSYRHLEKTPWHRDCYPPREGLSTVEVGRLGGVARAEALTPERRSEIARKAANARWRKRLSPDSQPNEADPRRRPR